MECLCQMTVIGKLQAFFPFHIRCQDLWTETFGYLSFIIAILNFVCSGSGFIVYSYILVFRLYKRGAMELVFYIFYCHSRVV